MKKALLLCLLAASSLLTPACSSKGSDPSPAPISPVGKTGAYTLDGRTTAATGYTNYIAAAPLATIDQLSIVLIASPVTLNENITIYIPKPKGSSDSNYDTSKAIIKIDAGDKSGYYDTPNAVTLVKTASGNWSGTFSGTRVNINGNPRNVLTAGSFTELAPK